MPLGIRSLEGLTTHQQAYNVTISSLRWIAIFLPAMLLAQTGSINGTVVDGQPVRRIGSGSRPLQ